MDLSGKTMAITGVGGFIGLRMAERARERGMKVKGFDMDPQAVKKAAAAGADAFTGNVTDEKDAARLCEGADVVFHTAAVMKEGGTMEPFRKVNVEGTRTVARAARNAGVQRFVHLSSVMVYGFTFPPDVTEDGPLRGENSPYCQTKIESEEAALGFHERGKMEVIVIRPGDVYGPGSVPWVVRPLQEIRRGRLPLIDGGKGTMNHVYVDNLLDGVFLALEKDATGTPFNLTDGQNTSWGEYLNRLAALAGKAPLRSVPSRLIRPVAEGVTRILEAFGRESPIHPSALGIVTRPHPYSIEKARRVLGYEPKVTLDEGMRRVEQWLRREKMI